MKNIIFAIAVMLLGATIYACGGSATEADDQAVTDEAVEETTDQVATDQVATDQDVSEQTVEEAVKVSESVDKHGPEYTAAYQCPMHCKGSGSDQPGKCPVCGMDYVAKADLEKATRNQMTTTTTTTTTTPSKEHEGHDH